MSVTSCLGSERSVSFSLPFRATLADYQQEAQRLYDALQAGDNNARWSFKWMHARYRGKSVSAVDPATLSLADAQVVVCHSGLAQRARGIAPAAVVVPFQVFMGDPAFERVEAAIRDGGVLAD